MSKEALQTPPPDQAEATRPAAEQGTGVKAGDLMIRLGNTSGSYIPGVELDSYQGKEGSYNVNSGMVCAVLPGGEVVSAPMSGVTERYMAEQELGLDKSMGVMGSNSEFYEGNLGEYARRNGRDHKLGLALVADTVEKTSVLPEYRDGGYVPGDWLAMSKMGHVHTRSDAAIKRGEIPQPEDLQVVDGISIAHDGQETETRLREVGHYGVNNGVLGFVDGWGEVYAAPATAEREAALLTAGYTPDSVGVPLSNGEQLFDKNQRKEWEAMAGQAAQERRAAA